MHDHFGSAGFFTIYDTEAKSVQVIANDNSHHAHGACQPLGMISGLGVDAVLTSGMGRRAVQLLNEGGVKVYLLDGDTVQQAVDKFAAGELPSSPSTTPAAATAATTELQGKPRER